MPTVPELIAVDEAAGTATTADVKRAEQEAHQAAEQVATLQQRVVDGDGDVTAEQIEHAKSLSGFAKLRAEATRRKQERTARAAWLRECDQLRAEIEAYAPGVGEKLAKKLAAAEKALNDFADAVHQHNTTLHGWHARIADLGFKKLEHRVNPLVPPASQAHLGHDGDTLIAGRRRLTPLDPDHYLSRMLAGIRLTRPGRPDSMPLSRPEYAQAEGVYEQLRQVDAPTGDPDPNLRFFRARDSGSVLTLDSKAFEPNKIGENIYQQQIDAGLLVEISRREAWGQ